MRVGLMRAGAPEPEDRLLSYAFTFRVGAVQVFLSAAGDPSVRASNGVVVAGRYVALGEPELVRDRTRGEYRLRAPLAAFAPLVDLSPGATTTSLTASVLLEPGVPAIPPGARAPLLVLDLADGRATTYTFRASACALPTKGR